MADGITVVLFNIPIKHRLRIRAVERKRVEARREAERASQRTRYQEASRCYSDL